MIIKLTRTHSHFPSFGYREEVPDEVFVNTAHIVKIFHPSNTNHTAVKLSDGELFVVKETANEIQHLANGTQDFSKTPL